MLRRLLGSRGFMSVAAVTVMALVVSALYLLVLRPPVTTRAYCAQMPDSIGLYVGNHVTLRGIPIGEVTGITPQGSTVRVDFEVDERHAVPADAGATTVSDTVVADRQLAVLPGADPQRGRDERGCLTRTLTPKSLTQTLDAVATLAKETLGPESGRQDAVRRGLAALESATSGTGPQINDSFIDLAALLDTPDAAVGHLAGTIDSLAEIANSASSRWGDIKVMLLGLATVLDQVNNELFSRTVEIIDSFQRLLPMLNEITTMFGDPIFRVLDASVPLIRVLRDNVDRLRDIVVKVPLLTAAATSALDPARGSTYAAPQVEIPAELRTQFCAATSAPDCESGRIPLTRLVFGLVGAR